MGRSRLIRCEVCGKALKPVETKGAWGKITVEPRRHKGPCGLGCVGGQGGYRALIYCNDYDAVVYPPAHTGDDCKYCQSKADKKAEKKRKRKEKRRKRTRER